MKPSNVIKGNFSMAQIDEVSSKLGGIEATQTHILKSLHVIENIFKDTVEKTIINTSKVDAAHTRLDKIEPVIEEYETNRDKGKGMWYVIAAAWTMITGGLGGYIAKILLP